ncbi:hypothetical protein AAMO2058_000130000 [Amorphochlora amoebiformis]
MATANSKDLWVSGRLRLKGVTAEQQAHYGFFNVAVVQGIQQTLAEYADNLYYIYEIQWNTMYGTNLASSGLHIWKLKLDSYKVLITRPKHVIHHLN